MRSKPCVVILGMHRSGTSMLAHILIKLGVDMGGDKNMLQPDSGNPLGYFEDKRFLNLNKKIIGLAGGQWFMPVDRKALFPIFNKYKRKIEKLIDLRYAEADEYWGWKDPRNCLTAWMYHQFLSENKVRYIIIRRNRPDVMLSLYRRNQDMVNWAKVAKNYDRHILAFLQTDAPRSITVHYEDFVKNRIKAAGEIEKIKRFLNIKADITKAMDIIQYEKN